METIVAYNQGRDAARRGDARVAPDTIEYPIVSRYEEFRRQTVSLSDHAKREWLAGFDRQSAPSNALYAPNRLKSWGGKIQRSAPALVSA